MPRNIWQKPWVLWITPLAPPQQVLGVFLPCLQHHLPNFGANSVSKQGYMANRGNENADSHRTNTGNSGKSGKSENLKNWERFLTVSCQGTPATRTPSAGPISTAAVPAVGIKVAIPVVLSWDPQKISWCFFWPVQDYSSILDYIIDEFGWIHKIFQPSSLTREWLKLAGTWPLPTPLRDSTDQKKT